MKEKQSMRIHINKVFRGNGDDGILKQKQSTQIKYILFYFILFLHTGKQQ